MPPVKPVEKPSEEKQPAAPALAVAVAEVEEVDDDLPTDPGELRTHAKNLRRQLRAAERKLEDAGLTRTEEKRLADEVAKLQVQLDQVVQRIAPTPAADDVSTAAPSTPAAAADDDSDCWLTIL